MTAAGRKAPSRAQNLIKNSLLFFQVCIFDGDSCQKCFCVTFDESNKARARKPRSMPISGASMTDKKEGEDCLWREQ